MFKQSADLISSGDINIYKSTGVPILYAFSFFFFGIDVYSAIYTAFFFGLLSIIIIFLLGYSVSKRDDFALVFTLIFSISPLHIYLSNTADQNVIGYFFLLCFWLFSFIYLDKPQNRYLFMAVSSASVASLTRIEYHGLFLLFPFFVFIFRRTDFWSHTLNFFKKSLIFLLALLPNLYFSFDHYLNFKDNAFHHGIKLPTARLTDWIHIPFQDYLGYMTDFLNVPLIFYFVVNFFFVFSIYCFLKQKPIFDSKFSEKKIFIFILLIFLYNFLVYISWFYFSFPYLSGKSRFFLPLKIFFNFILAYGIIYLRKKNLHLKLISVSILVFIVIFNLLAFFNMEEVRRDQHRPHIVYAVSDVSDNPDLQGCTIISGYTVFFDFTRLKTEGIDEFFQKTIYEDIDLDESCYLIFCENGCSWMEQEHNVDLDKLELELVRKYHDLVVLYRVVDLEIESVS